MAQAKLYRYTNPEARVNETTLLKAQFLITRDRLQCEQQYAGKHMMLSNNITEVLTTQLLELADYISDAGDGAWLAEYGVVEVEL